MVEVRYTKIHIEGFRSIVAPLSFNLDRLGINLIQGVNGVGKSTIFNALFWCEYGINLKKSVEPWKELITPTYRGTRVIVERGIGDKDYRICRHLNFKGTTLGLKGDSRLMIFQKSKDEPNFTAEHLIDAKYKEDQQAEIISQLGIDDKTFLQSVIFGQKMSSLVETSPKDKREIFDTLFAVGFVDEANEKAKAERLRVSNEISTKNSSISSLESVLTKDKELLESMKTTETTFASDKKEALEKLQKDIAKLEESIAERQKALKKAETDFNKQKVPDVSIKEKYEAKKKEYDTAIENTSAANRKVKSAESQIETSNSLIQGYEDSLKNISTTCPTCGGALSKDKIKTAKDNLTSSLTKERDEVLVCLQNNLKDHKADAEAKKKLSDKLNGEVAQLKQDYDNYSSDLEEYNKLRNAKQPIIDRIGELQSDLKDKKADYVIEKAKKFDRAAMDTLETAIEGNEKLLEQTKKEVEALNTKHGKVDWWVKKGFGATGIKSFVFNSMLTKLNVIAQKYAERLGFGVEFTIDMTKETRPFQMLIYKGADVKDYDDLSGGQQQRVNVCIAFAMHDLVSSSKTSINLLVMDEKFEALDQEGTEAAFELIQAKAESKSVYVITHSHIIDVLNSKTIEIVMENGTTVINEN